jgi:microcystin-dependent protein
MNLRRINYHCSCGSCSECTGGNANSYFEGMTQVPNVEQIVPIPGPAGEGSILVAGKTDSSGVLNADGTDEALDSTAKANLLAADFDITVKPTTQNVVDASDINSNRVWTGLSRSILNFLGLKVVPKLLPDIGSNGNILKAAGGIWTSDAPDWEKYNSTTTTSQAFSEASTSLIDTTVVFAVGTGYSYRFKNVVAIVDTVSPLSNYIEGIVEAYSAGNLTVRIKNIKGSGNTLNYNVMLTAPEYLPFIKDPENYGKFFYNNSGVIEMRSSIESVGDTKIWFSSTPPDTSWWLCDGTTKLLSESPGLYNLLVTQNGGVASPFYVSGTSFTLPNSTGATLVGVKSTGDDSITLGQIIGNNILAGGIPKINLPVVAPYKTAAHNHGVLAGSNGFITARSGTGTLVSGAGVDLGIDFTTGNTANTDLTNNNIAGGQAADGGQDFDIRQKSLGMFLFIKAL